MLDQRIVDAVKEYLDALEQFDLCPTKDTKAEFRWTRTMLINEVLTAYRNQCTISQPNEALSEQFHQGND